MILPDKRLSEIVRSHWKDYDLKNVNPASVDLALSDQAIVYDWPLHYRLLHRLFPESQKWLRRRRTVKLPYMLRPGEMALLSTKEWVVVPPKYAAIMTLKSSRGREGYDHALAGYFDPGFRGNAVLEVYANAVPVWLDPGLKIAQLILIAMLQEPSKPYAGHYQNQKGVTESWTTL